MSIVLTPPRVLRLLVLAVLALGAAPSLSAAVIYDFVAKAPEAKWYRTLSPAGALPWNGADGDSRGFARHLANAALENGKILHPRPGNPSGVEERRHDLRRLRQHPGPGQCTVLRPGGIPEGRDGDRRSDLPGPRLRPGDGGPDAPRLQVRQVRRRPRRAHGRPRRLCGQDGDIPSPGRRGTNGDPGLGRVGLGRGHPRRPDRPSEGAGRRHDRRRGQAALPAVELAQHPAVRAGRH